MENLSTLLSASLSGNSNLTNRLLTGAVLIAVACAIFAAGTWMITAVCLVLNLRVVYEFYQLSLGTDERSVYQHTAAAALLPLGFFYAGLPGLLTGLIVAFIAIAIVQLWGIEASQHEPDFHDRVPAAFTGLLYPGLLSALLIVLAMQPGLRWYLAWLLAIVVFSDSTAFFGGRLLGGEKMAPRISPGKTRNGAICGFAGAMFAAVLFDYLLALPIGFFHVVVYGATAAILAQCGDLCESLVKRVYHVKDSSQIFPGHGGVLDRIDALMFAAPVLFFIPG